MNDNEWYELDEDNRKKDPANGLFCCRCKRLIRDTNPRVNFITVELSQGYPIMVRISKLKGTHQIGSDCWDKIYKSK